METLINPEAKSIDGIAVKRRLWLAAGWLLLAVVLWGILTPEPPRFISPPLPQFDKLEHFGAFLLLNSWFIAARAGRRRRWVFTAIFILLGGLIEIVQAWSGFRDGDWLDWTADCVGVLVGAWWPSRWLERIHAWFIGLSLKTE